MHAALLRPHVARPPVPEDSSPQKDALRVSPCGVLGMDIAGGQQLPLGHHQGGEKINSSRSVMDMTKPVKGDDADGQYANRPQHREQMPISVFSDLLPQLECSSNPLEKHELLLDDAHKTHASDPKGYHSASMPLPAPKKPAPSLSADSNTNPASASASISANQKPVMAIRAQPLASDVDRLEPPLDDKQMTLLMPAPPAPPRLSRSNTSLLDLSSSQSGLCKSLPQDVPPRRSRLNAVASDVGVLTTTTTGSASLACEERERDKEKDIETSSQASEKSTEREHSRVPLATAHSKPGSDAAEPTWHATPPAYDSLGSRTAPVQGQRHVIAGLHEVSMHSLYVNSAASAEMPWEIKASGNPTGAVHGHGRASPVPSIFPGAMQHPGVYVCMCVWHACVVVAWPLFVRYKGIYDVCVYVCMCVVLLQSMYPCTCVCVRVCTHAYTHTHMCS
jgi:hypothetical protein